jgi:hypothetical protein
VTRDDTPAAGPTLTVTARSALAGILRRVDAAPEVSVRLVSGGDGYELLPDTVAADDVAYVHEGRTVLLVSSDVRDRLTGFVVDADENDDGVRLTIAKAG